MRISPRVKTADTPIKTRLSESWRFYFGSSPRESSKSRLRPYSRRNQIGATIETQNYAAEIRLRAERRLGQMLMDAPKAKGGGEKGVGRRGKQCGAKSEPHSSTPTLASVGITKKESSRSQELAAVPEAEFEAALVVEPGKELNHNRVLIGRRNITLASRCELAEKLAEALRPMAKENQKQHGQTAPGRKKDTSGNTAKSESINVREQAAKEAGVSDGSLKAFRFLKHNAEPEELAEKLAEALKPKAKENQAKAGPKSGRGKKPTASGNTAKSESINVREQAAKEAGEIEPFFAKEAKERQIRKPADSVVGHVPTTERSRDRAASAVGLSGKTVSAAKAIKAASPERFEKIKQGTLTMAKAKKEVKADKDRQQMEQAAKAITADKAKSLLEVCDVRHCSCAELFASGIKPDLTPRLASPRHAGSILIAGEGAGGSKSAKPQH